MKILIITQKVDAHDPVLGFFCRWIKEFSLHTEQVTVLCLSEGIHDLPQAIRVISLGKGRIHRLINLFRQIINLRNEYDVVFVHMNPEYVVVGGLIWKILSKPIALWYTHKSVTWKLRIAERLSNIVFTASHESFRLLSDKLHVMGHGIDVNQFNPVKKDLSVIFKILSAGRISPYKEYEIIIQAIALVQKKSRKGICLDIIGTPAMSSDYKYLESLKKIVEENNLSTIIRFRGAISHDQLPQEFASADLFVHASKTGSLDKVLLEAMASGIPVISSSDVATNLLEDPLLIIEPRNPEAFSRAILRMVDTSPEERSSIGVKLRNSVIRNHDITTLIQKIVTDLICFVSK